MTKIFFMQLKETQFPPRLSEDEELPLRERAIKAYKDYDFLFDAWNLSFSRQMFFLMNSLLGVYSDFLPFTLEMHDWEICAKVDDLMLVSAYNKSWREPQGTVEQQAMKKYQLYGLRLWWKCADCGFIARSPEFHTMRELGYLVENFKPENSHQCEKE